MIEFNRSFRMYPGLYRSQLRAHFVNHIVPETGFLLPEERHTGVPFSGFLFVNAIFVHSPSPVGGASEHRPYLLADGAGKMYNGCIDRNHEIEI